LPPKKKKKEEEEEEEDLPTRFFSGSAEELLHQS